LLVGRNASFTPSSPPTATHTCAPPFIPPRALPHLPQALRNVVGARKGELAYLHKHNRTPERIAAYVRELQALREEAGTAPRDGAP